MHRTLGGVCTTGLVLIVAFGAACEAIIGIERRYLTTSDASPSGPCTSQQPPLPPTGTQNGPSDGGADLDLTFGLQQFEFGLQALDEAGRPLYESIGFDLDHSCTPQGRRPGCVEPPWAKGIHADPVNGIDNAFGELQWQNEPDPTTADAGTVLADWQQAVLFRVRGYSGAPDDDRVNVSVYVSIGKAKRADGQMGVQWDGNDQFDLLKDALSSEGGAPDVDQPLYYDDRAYVTGYVLVAHVAETIWASVYPVRPTHIYGLVLQGKLVSTGAGSWDLRDIVFGFRVPVAEGLYQLAANPAGANNEVLCQASSANYTEAITKLCNVVDVTWELDAGPSSQCDAISLGALAQGKPVKLGGVSSQSPSALAMQCAGGTDPIATCGP